MVRPNNESAEFPLSRLEAFANDLIGLGDPQATRLGSECLECLTELRARWALRDQELSAAVHLARVESARAEAAQETASKWNRRASTARLERDELAVTLEMIADGAIPANRAQRMARKTLDELKERRRGE